LRYYHVEYSFSAQETCHALHTFMTTYPSLDSFRWDIAESQGERFADYLAWRICLLTLSTARTDIDRFNIRSICPSIPYRELHVSYQAVQWNLLLRSCQSRQKSRVVLDMEYSEALMNQLFTTEPNAHNLRSTSAVMRSHGKSIASKASVSRWI